MKDKINTPLFSPAGLLASWRALPVLGALALAVSAQAQVLLQEDFTGGASTTGFTIDDTGSDCAWLYAPGGLTNGTFSLDFDGELPAGAGFDSDFAFLDSDDCGSSGVIVNSFLISPPFDASAASNYTLSFDHQFRARLESFARVEVFNGTDWVQVANYTDSDVGYPNPAVSETINITDATGGFGEAQVRFQFNAGWDWWWAIDNIVIEMMDCAAPPGLAITDLTTEGGMLTWSDNGSAGYEWAVTTGELPDGTNELAGGDGADNVIAGLNSGTLYTAWVRADCGDGTFSPWSSGADFVTMLTNDDCSEAIALLVNSDAACGSTTSGTVMGATDSGLTSTCFGTADDDVWFSFVAESSSHIISLLNVQGSTTDLYHALWTGADCGSLELVPGTCSDPDLSLASDLTPGETYYLQVYTYTSTPGQNTTFEVCIGTPPPPPANDECSGAVALTVNPNYNCAVTTPGTVAWATGSGITSTCSGTPNDDVWYSFVATDTLHRISLTNITGSTSDMYMALWAGDCTDLEQVPLSCSDPQTMNIGGLTIGTTYYLQVYTYTSSTGQTSAFDVCVGTEPFCQPPLNIALDNIEAPDAMVTWTDNTATEYAYELRVSGAAGSGATGLVEAGSVAGSPLNLTGLVADSLYVLYVRSICSPGDTSAWSSGLDILDGYCNTLAITNTVEPICNVTFAGIDNDSPSTVGGSTPALEDFTNLVANVEQGGNYTISATGNTAGDFDTYITAYFDWDQDNVFETVVPLGFITNTVCGIVISAEVDVPADAALGQSRMRVVKNFNAAPIDPCGSYSYGQAEDYTVEMTEHVAVPDCEGVPDGPAQPGTPCIASTGLGGMWSDECVCEENVGIAELVATEGIALYPNPASTELFLSTASGSPVHVKVFDMVGHLAMERQVVDRMNISQLAPGSYNLLITDGSGQLVARSRFVKQ